MKNAGRSILPVLLFYLLSFAPVFAQIPVGKWRAHLSYDSIQAVTGSEDKIFAASQSGILIYNKNYNSTETFDKVKGLSDAGISSIAWSVDQQALLIGYHNGNLDVLKDGEVTNYPHLKDHAHNRERKITSITFRQKMALLSCPFGIAVFDMERGEFSETYQPGLEKVLNVNDVDYDEQYYYAATDKGLFYADISNSELYNPDSWERVTAFPDYTRKVKHVEAFGKYILMAVKEEGADAHVYYMNDLNNSGLLLEGKVRTLNATPDQFYVVLSDKIRIYHSDLTFLKEIVEYASYSSRPTSLFYGSAGNLWIGDGHAGLIRLTGNSEESIFPDGPTTDHAFEMVSMREQILSVPGAYDEQMSPLKKNGIIQKFSNQQWNSMLFSPYHSFVDVAIDPEHPDQLSIGTWGQGLLRINMGKASTHQFNKENSTLEATENQGEVVYGLTYDRSGHLWMLNHGSENPVKFMGSGGEWKTFEYEALQNKLPVRLMATDHGYKWGFLYNSPYLFVIDDRGSPSDPSDDRIKIIEPKDFNGKSYAKRIYAIQQDKEGNIWIATDEGIGVDYDPANVFEEDTYQPNRLRITEKGYTHFMLRDNRVTDIAVGPANQIWFATKTAGIFAYNPNEQEMIHHFTASDSPLLTDTLQSVAINDKGEVFIGTSRGMVSYRSSSSLGKETFRDTYAFPNPVPPDYQGIITITNLVRNVNVKITDINGNLVYETMAEGGQATWNGKDFSGRPVGSGVYLIFLTTKDGSKTHVEKLLFIR
ncbi:MAG: two-component regulator propeller domain-containing protein [Bacteroidota bacterium]